MRDWSRILERQKYLFIYVYTGAVSNVRLERTGECIILAGFIKTGISWSINKIDV